METKIYIGTRTGEAGGFDGFAGLTIGNAYQGETQPDGRVHIVLPTGRPTSVSLEQWERWFK